LLKTTSLEILTYLHFLNPPEHTQKKKGFLARLFIFSIQEFKHYKGMHGEYAPSISENGDPSAGAQNKSFIKMAQIILITFQ
jgi:hypothetical protein